MADLTGFHNVRFPQAIAFGATGGPEWRNEIVGLTSGRERRNQRFAGSRRRYDAGSGVRSLDDLHEVIAFFEARRGSLYAFRFRDPFDNRSCPPQAATTATDQPIGTGDGTNRRFALTKVYGEGGQARTRAIQTPVPVSIKLAVNGVALNAANYTFDLATGEVVIGSGPAPANGAEVTAGFEFDVPVRFDFEHLSLSLSAFKAGQIPSIPLIEVLL